MRRTAAIRPNSHSKVSQKVAQKLGEEGVELALAAVIESDTRVKEEAADLIFHLLLLLALRGIPLQEVVAELEQRHDQRRPKVK